MMRETDRKVDKKFLLGHMLAGAWRQSRFFRGLLILELALLGAGLLGLLQKSELKAEWQEERLYAPGEESRQTTGSVSLPAGVYDLRIQYETTENGRNTVGVRAEGETFYGLLSNDIPLYTGIHERSGLFYLTRHTDRLQAAVYYCGEGDLQIRGIQVYSTNCAARIYLFALILLSVGADLLVLFYLDTEGVFGEMGTKAAFLGIPLTALAASLPLLTDYLIIGADLIFHLLRIEGLAGSIRQGVFPARVESMWLYGHGYANSIFYGDTFLYLPALIRLLGLPVAAAYKIYVAAVNLATALAAYYSFRGCAGLAVGVGGGQGVNGQRISEQGSAFAGLAAGDYSRIVGLAGSVLYTLSPYRIYNIYNRAAVGEYTAMIFLPLLCYGFYRIFTMDERGERKRGTEEKGATDKEDGRKSIEERKDRWAWLLLVMGFSGIIQSHTLSCEIVAVFVALLCLIRIRKIFRIRIFISLALAAAGTVVVNLWFLVPLLDMMLADKYYFHRAAGILVQKRGVLASLFFYTMQGAGSSSKYFETGMVGGEPIGLGAGLLAAAALCLVMLFAGRLGRIEKKAALTAGLLGLAGLYGSSVYFPWDRLQRMGGLGATLISSLQFPTRITVIPTLCAAFMACLALSGLRGQGKRYAWAGACLAGISLLFSMYQTNDILLTKGEFLRLYTTENIGHSAVLGGEYVPEGVEIPLLTYEEATGSEGVEINRFEKKGLSTVTEVAVEDGVGDYYLELPVIFYKGYRAEMGGEPLALAKGSNGRVRVLLPAGAAGEVRVRYAGMWYWRVSEGISLAGMLGLAAIYIKGRKGYEKNHCKRVGDQ